MEIFAGRIISGLRLLGNSFFLSMICKIYNKQKITSVLFDSTDNLSAGDQDLGVIQGSLTREEIAENAGRMLDSYGDSMLRLAYSYLHNMSDSEDIVQDALIKYMKTTPEFENTAHEKAWLLRVTANLAKNRIEYNKVRQSDELEDTLIQEEKEDLSFIWDAVKSLPDNMREVIHLYYHEGYSTKEIASILKRKESTVRSDMKRGRERLKTVLKEVYDFE